MRTSRYLLILSIILLLSVTIASANHYHGLGAATTQSTTNSPIIAPLAQPGIDCTARSGIWTAWQPFTAGVMMWWSDTNQIWVMKNNSNNYAQAPGFVGTLQVFANPYNGPAPTGPAPQQPYRGFGNLPPAVIGQVGSAMAPEIGYNSGQRIGQGIVIVQGPGSTVYQVDCINLRWQTLKAS